MNSSLTLDKQKALSTVFIEEKIRVKLSVDDKRTPHSIKSGNMKYIEQRSTHVANEPSNQTHTIKK